MIHKRIKPEDHPPKKGESWWVVHPNNAKAEFRVPMGAVTVCCPVNERGQHCPIKEFEYGKVYPIIGCDNHNGWITLKTSECLVDMPQYLFARYFDAEQFVIGNISPAEIETARPFDYKPTINLPMIGEPESSGTPLKNFRDMVK